MKRRTKRKTGRCSVWNLSVTAAAVILASGAVVSVLVFKGILNWDTSEFIMKAATAVTCGLATHKCIAIAENQWACVASMLIGTITMLLIIESTLGGQVVWNPLPGIAACGIGCAVGLLWAMGTNTAKKKNGLKSRKNRS